MTAFDISDVAFDFLCNMKVCYVITVVDNSRRIIPSIRSSDFLGSFQLSPRNAPHTAQRKPLSSDVEVIHTVTSQNANNLFK